MKKLFWMVRNRQIRLDSIAMDLLPSFYFSSLDKKAVADNKETDEFINEFYLTRKHD